MNSPLKETIAICKEYQKALKEQIYCDSPRGLQHLLRLAKNNVKSIQYDQPTCAYWLGKVQAIKNKLKALK